MYGKLVKVNYKGNEYKIWVNCIPATPMKELQRRAETQLAAYERDRPDLSIGEIVAGINNGAFSK